MRGLPEFLEGMKIPGFQGMREMGKFFDIMKIIFLGKTSPEVVYGHFCVIGFLMALVVSQTSIS